MIYNNDNNSCPNCRCKDCRCKKKCPNCPNNQNIQEGFISGFKSRLRPHIRSVNQSYDNLVNNYGPSALAHKLQKWNIYG